ncbi:hypothetical protein PsYK624_167100 [Phanerochaete sordida]|uniref:Uncharacterized protein n=1 Tax=Phanerochaete sordida TaxID=48140 RepID=A0A9P3LMC4_9APHY|nr:hypothetical protein PsYK624_167100 [Phanerochaete sordida]
MPLAVQDVVVALFHRNKPDSFHWALAVYGGGDSFVKFHATNTPGGLWAYKREDEATTETRPELVALVKIGNLGAVGKTAEDVHDAVKDINMATPRQDGGRRTPFDCIIWLRQAVRALDAAGFLECKDAVALEEECQDIAEQYAPEVLDGEGTYVIRVSQFSRTMK